MHVIDATISERFCDIPGWAGFETQHQRSETEEERRSLCACAETRCMGGAFVRLCGGDKGEVQRGVAKTSHFQSQDGNGRRTTGPAQPGSENHTNAVPPQQNLGKQKTSRSLGSDGIQRDTLVKTHRNCFFYFYNLK